MRRASISRRVGPGLALLLLALLPACSHSGSPQAGSAGPGSPTAAGTSASAGTTGSPVAGASSGGSPATGTPGTGSSAGVSAGGAVGCPNGVNGGQVTLTEKDNGASVCLSRGASLFIYLHAPLGQEWSKPTPQSPVLQPTAVGRGALQMGVTGGFFSAAATGDTRVTAQLAPCRGPKPGPACDVIELFQVTVTVR